MPCQAFLRSWNRQRTVSYTHLDVYKRQVWYGEEEIFLARGSSVLNSSRVQILSWSEAAERIRELLESGQYAMNVELEEAAGYERLTVAQSIWYLYHDPVSYTHLNGCLNSSMN